MSAYPPARRHTLLRVMALMAQKAVAAVVFSTAFGVLGTGLGGLTGALLGMRGRRLVPLLFNLSSGMMIAVVCFELLPQAYALGLSLSVMGMLLGVLCVMALSLALDRHHRQGTDAAAMRRTGLLVLLSLALHNFPEGLAVGAGYAAEPRLGLMLGIMIMLHDVPEGVASGLPLRAGGVSVAGAVGMTVLSGLPASGKPALAQSALPGGRRTSWAFRSLSAPPYNGARRAESGGRYPRRGARRVFVGAAARVAFIHAERSLSPVGLAAQRMVASRGDRPFGGLRGSQYR